MTCCITCLKLAHVTLKVPSGSLSCDEDEMPRYHGNTRISVFLYYVHITKKVFCFIPPNQQRWHAKWKLSRNMYALHTRFCTFGTDFAHSVGA